MESIFKVAIAQISPVFLQKEASIQKACEYIEAAAENGAKLIVFPETYISAYPDWTWLIPSNKGGDLNKLYSQLVDQALSITKAETSKLCKAAKKSNILVAIGCNERNTESSNSSIYNSLLLINEKGKIIGKHRKLMPTGAERLIWSQGDGGSLQCYSTSIGILGGLICWENLMPLARTALYEQGLQILIAPTWDKSANWQNSMKHIAVEGGVFVISACMALHKDDIPDEYEFKALYPKDREWINGGNSCIIGPKGNVIAGPMENEQGLLYADLDLNEITAAKRLFDVAGHYSRPDVFQFKLKKK